MISLKKWIENAEKDSGLSPTDVKMEICYHSGVHLSTLYRWLELGNHYVYKRETKDGVYFEIYKLETTGEWK